MQAPPAATPGRRSRFVVAAIACGAAAWLVGVALGFAALFDHASAPGRSPEPPAYWPANAPCERVTDVPALLMFVHPGCPCTLASLGELERVIAKCAGRVAATVLFRDDPANGLDAVASPAWRVVARIPGVHARIDAGDAAARAFGVTTSGSVVLYGPDGRLLFHGGITGSRGHEGDNAGACAAVAAINDLRAPAVATAVFGCELCCPSGPVASRILAEREDSRTRKGPDNERPWPHAASSGAACNQASGCGQGRDASPPR